MTKSELKDIIKECIQEINNDNMSISEAVKIINTKENKHGKYFITNLKISNFNLEIEEKYQQYFDIIESAVKAIKKDWKSIVLSAAEDMYNKVESYNESIKEKYKTPEILSKKIKVQHNPFVQYCKENEVLINICFDTNPYLDPHHVYSKFVTYYVDKNELKYDDYEYDG